MKYQIKLLLSIAVLVPVFAVGTVFAQQSVEPAAPTTERPPTAQPRALTAEEKAQLNERVQQRKAEAKLRLTNAQQRRIQTQCKASQGVVQSVYARHKGIETKHTQVYGNLVDRLTSLEGKLVDSKADTAELKVQIAELQIRIATFKTDLSAYLTLGQDLVSMECTVDPVAFKASLDATRIALQKVRADALSIRSYVSGTIKPTLQAIRAQLAGEPAGASKQPKNPVAAPDEPGAVVGTEAE